MKLGSASPFLVMIAFASHTALAQDAAPCSDVGAGQRPHLKPGIYHVANDPETGVAHLYYRNPETDAETQLGEAAWDLTSGITAVGRWLYIISEGKLHRVNPETGEWFPKPFDGTGRCAWYVGWPGPIWTHKKRLYAIKPHPEDPNESQIQRLNFEAASQIIVNRFFVNSLSVE